MTSRSEAEWERLRQLYWHDWSHDPASFRAWLGPNAIEAADLLDACVRPRFQVQVWDEDVLIVRVGDY